MSIYLVRHGESEANVNNKILLEKSDCDISLTENGFNQAKKTASFLKKYIEKEHSGADITVVGSSYLRAKQTKLKILDKLSEIKSLKKLDNRFSDFLVEINLGLFSGLDPKTEYQSQDKKAYDYFHLNKKNNSNGYFYTAKPLGESYWDVCNRIQLEVQNITNSSRENNNVFIVVAHGGINRCFAKIALGESVDWFKMQENPRNCEVWKLDVLNKKLEKGIYIP